MAIDRRTALKIALAASTAVTMPAWSAPLNRKATDEAARDLRPRLRTCISDGWRFHLGDPSDAGTKLLYDVLPVVTETTDGKPGDAVPEAGERRTDAGRTVLKPWILPTANRFIKDPAQRHTRPEGHPGGDVSFVQRAFDDSGWRQLDLPHDWAIEGEFLVDGPYGNMGRLKSWGPCWYRKTLDFDAKYQGKSVFLDVDGAMSYATVWLNEKLVGGWPGGYTSWRVDLTPYVIAGAKNSLVIRLDSPPESSRWYPGAGIYRNVWVTVADPVHVGQWGTDLRTSDVSKDAAAIDLAVTVDNTSQVDAVVALKTDIFPLTLDGNRVGRPVASVANAPAIVLAGESLTFNGRTSVSKPRLWGPAPTQTPHRYVAVTSLLRDGRIIDRYETSFGIRDLRFDPDKGLFVNGEHVPLKGVCNHHDLGALGAAFNVRAAERQLEMLSDMGFNALRTTHNPPAPELLELTDRMGILVYDEIFDIWERKKTALDTHLTFADWHEPDLRSLIRRDRNHPSVIIWGVGNEVGEQYTGEEGAAVARRLVAIAHEEDATRPATEAMNYAKSDMPMPGTLDLIGLNYQGAGIRSIPPQYPAFRAKYPKTFIFGSETASAVSSRGEYLFPVPGGNSAWVRPGIGGDFDRHQVSAYELFATDAGSSPDRAWAADDQNPFVAGEFVWTGFDYIGEPTPFQSSRSSYFGIIDLAGFKKDRFWLYQSRWRPDLPMAHILPHWTWPDRLGQVTPVHVFSSGDEAELFVNGKSQGRIRKKTERTPYDYRFRWDYVIYEPGEVSVITYCDSKEWARASVKTAGPSAALQATPDRVRIIGDGKDLSFVTVRVVDRNHDLSPRANDRIRFTIEGPGEIVVTDNGDPTDMQAFRSTTRKAFNGLALAIVRAKPGQSGRVTVTAMAEGLEPASATIACVTRL